MNNNLKEKQIEQASKVLSELTGIKFTTDDIKIIEQETKAVIKARDEELLRRLEEDNNLIFGYSSKYFFFNVYVVSTDEEVFDEELEAAKQGYVWSYVQNLDNPVFSEYGTVRVDKELERIA